MSDLLTANAALARENRRLREEVKGLVEYADEERQARLRATSECAGLRAQVQSLTAPDAVTARDLEHRRYMRAVRA